MSFLIENFSPVGGNARSGNMPQNGIAAADKSVNSIQVFTYSSEDSVALIFSPGYFNEVGRGIVRRGDWLDIASNVDVGDGQSIRFVLGDGSFPSALTAVFVVPGAGYAIGDLIEVTFTDGTIDQKTILEVSSVSSGVVTGLIINDPGFFSVVPTSLTALATVALTGSGNDALTVTLTLATQPNEALVTIDQSKSITAE